MQRLEYLLMARVAPVVCALVLGWSFLTFADSAFEGYAAFRGYEFDAQTRGFGALTWENLVAAIDANRPFMSLVDVDGNGSTDHFIPVLGYDDRGALGRFLTAYFHQRLSSLFGLAVESLLADSRPAD